MAESGCLKSKIGSVVDLSNGFLCPRFKHVFGLRKCNSIDYCHSNELPLIGPRAK